MLKTLHNLLFILLLTLVFGEVAHGQAITRTSVDAGGESYTQQGITLTFVVGEAIGDLLSNPGENKYLTTGFIQPDPIIEISQVLASSPKSIAIFPNPASGGIVKLAFNHVPDGYYTINVYDAAGKILQTQSVDYSSQSYYYFPIDISHYTGGTYFIQVINPTKFQGQVKLIKF